MKHQQWRNDMKQPEALRLADDLKRIGAESSLTRHQAVHELLCLHAKMMEMDQVIDQRNAMISNLYKENQAMLKVLKHYADANNWTDDEQGIFRCWMEPESTTPKQYNGFEIARAAIAKATGAE